MSKIFICYSHQSQDTAKRLAKHIKELGHDVWFDEELPGGQVWLDSIFTEIRESDIFVFLLTQESQNSTVCNMELKHACDLNKSILPIKIDDTVSIDHLQPNLSNLQILNYQKQDSKILDKLRKAINSLQSQQPFLNTLTKQPEEPILYAGMTLNFDNINDRIVQILNRVLTFKEIWMFEHDSVNQIIVYTGVASGVTCIIASVICNRKPGQRSNPEESLKTAGWNIGNLKENIRSLSRWGYVGVCFIPGLGLLAPLFYHPVRATAMGYVNSLKTKGHKTWEVLNITSSKSDLVRIAEELGDAVRVITAPGITGIKTIVAKRLENK